MRKQMIFPYGTDETWWLTAEANYMRKLHCTAHTERGTPEQCGELTFFYVVASDDTGHKDNGRIYPACREHVLPMYNALMLLHGSAEAHQFTMVQIPKWGTEKVAPDALPPTETYVCDGCDKHPVTVTPSDDGRGLFCENCLPEANTVRAEDDTTD